MIVKRYIHIILILLIIITIDGFAKSKAVIKKNSLTKNARPGTKKKVDPMMGRTHYGMKIIEYRRVIFKNDFQIQMIYSKHHSDDNMNRKIDQFYKEFYRQAYRWISRQKPKKTIIKIIISNCRFCKIGYCKKINKKRISLMRFNNKIQGKVFTFYHSDIYKKQGQIITAKRAVKSIFGK